MTTYIDTVLQTLRIQIATGVLTSSGIVAAGDTPTDVTDHVTLALAYADELLLQTGMNLVYSMHSAAALSRDAGADEAEAAGVIIVP